MTDTLYSWVSVTKDTFPEENGEYHWRNKDTKLPISPALAYTTARIGERYHAVEMLEAVSSPGDNQSLEEAAKQFARKHCKGCNKSVKNYPCLCGPLEAAFLAGAAYVKGGEGLVDELRKANPYEYQPMGDNEGFVGWNKCCYAIEQLLNQKEQK